MIETYLDRSGLSVRTCNTLIRAGYRTLNEVVALSNDELIRIKNLGRRQMEEVIEIRKKFREVSNNGHG